MIFVVLNVKLGFFIVLDMWKLNPFTPKEPTSLEGRYVDVGNVKIYIRNAIAQGGFSCVYLARDAMNTSKQYALKHIICNDGELLELVVKEISVMKMLKGHPNVVSLVGHTIQDKGPLKEALLVMEFCENSLVTLLEKRGVAYLQEKQILSIFRDVCNAVFAMHSQSPPIAHRDLKAENILLGSDGAWKLCDFGSTSTKHKCFDRPEERGIEEDNIRKHTTPAYRAPEMWDLYRKEVISEKVDIWALGCLLYRICYLKSAFDGESKLQILNGNYHIPEAPKYGSSITQLIKDMLKASPDARPDITQVWFRLNEQLPVELQKHLPDGPATTGITKNTDSMPQRKSTPPTSSRQQARNNPPQSQGTQKPIGAFWTSHHAQDTAATSFGNKESTSKAQQLVIKSPSHNEAEMNSLKEQLKQAILEKDEITSKYEKLYSVCHSQRQEIQELKRALAAATPSPQLNMDSSKSQISPGTPQKDKIEPGIWELEQAMLANSFPSPYPSSQTWEAFTDEPKATPASNINQSGLFWPTNGLQNITKQPSALTPTDNSWAFGQNNGLLFPASTTIQSNTTQRSKEGTGQPLGWAGF